MRTLCSLSVLVLLGLWSVWAAPTAQADVLTLNDGRVIEGEVVSAEGADPLRIRVREGSISAVFSYPRSDIKSLVEGPSERQLAVRDLRQALVDLRRSEGSTAEDWWEVAKTFQDMGENLEYHNALRQLLEVYPDFAPARQALGQRQVDGNWLSEAEAMRERGLVRYDGAWRTPEEVEILMAQEAARREEAQQQADIRRAQRQMRAQAQRNASSAPAFSIYSVSSGYSRYSSGHYRRCPYWGSSFTYRQHGSRGGFVIGQDEVIR